MLQTLGIQRSIAAARKQKSLFSGWHVKKSNDGDETSAAENQHLYSHEARKPIPKGAKLLQAEKAKANTPEEVERALQKLVKKGRC